jgi:NAD(P)-dependent dehydrogenase (short-subunit alcohol dehydrogenase family)
MTDFSLSGRVAVVTGGSGMLGVAIARGLCAAGARTAVVARDPARGEDAVRRLVDAGGEAAFEAADVLVEAELAGARDRILERWGSVDVLVNAAGGNRPDATLGDDGDLRDLVPAAFERVVSLNLTGAVVATQAFLEALLARREAVPSAAVVNVSSMTAQRGISRVPAYSAAKAGVEAFTRWLAVDLATRFEGRVRVNAIAPGFFLADQNRALLLNGDGTPTARLQRILDRTPMGRLGDPDDVAGTIVWLCTDASRFVTGVVVPIDGGFSASGGV